MFVNYANYWAIRPKIKPYAIELYLEWDFWNTETGTPYLERSDWFLRSCRLDGISFHPDQGGYCIDEVKTTYDMGGSIKYYNPNNPQLLMQKLLYDKNKQTQNLPEIKGTMMDIWDKGKNKGIRQFVLFNDKVVKQYEQWLIRTLQTRKEILSLPRLSERNFLVCNTFNDAFRSQCKYKERCASDAT